MRTARNEILPVDHDVHHHPAIASSSVDILIIGGLSAAVVFFLHLRKYVRDGQLPSVEAVIALLAIYVWFLPPLIHPVFLQVVPLFHSLQYLLFAYEFRKKKVESQIEDRDTPIGRKTFLTGVWGYFACSCILGALAFEIVPYWLDQAHLLSWSYGKSESVSRRSFGRHQFGH